MTDPLLWMLITLQIAFGAFDTLVHHEMTERLAWRQSQRQELKLHGVRNFFYAGVFVVIGWTAPTGALAALLLAVLAAEVFITLWDFVEEDRSRRLPASERVLHTLMALNYGAILALMAPVLIGWAGEATSLGFAYHGIYSWFCIIGALGAGLFGARDLAAARHLNRIAPAPAAPLAKGLQGRRDVLVTGGTGFVGARLVEALAGAGHNVTVLTRNPERAMAQLPAPLRLITDLGQIADDENIDAIVHLAGESISNGLWTEAKKRRVIESRVRLTEALTALAARLEKKPDCFIAASAVGWYGIRGPEPLMETHNAETASFSHQSCEAVEAAARKMERQNIRTIRLRIGLVLGVEGGLLARMLTPFEFGLGGPFGDGRQIMSWIARDDLVRLIVHVMKTPALAGAVNATAPGAVSNETFSRALAAALGRPALFRIPAFPISLLLGRFADELLLGGQNVKPDKAQATGFEFEEPDLAAALRRMVGAQEALSQDALPKERVHRFPALEILQAGMR